MTFSGYSFLMYAFLMGVGSAVIEDHNCRGPNLFQCTNEVCVSQLFVCDEENDCGDNSDEMNCPDKPIVHVNATTECAWDQFKCRDNHCISMDEFCDRQVDCPDESDEYDGCTLKKTCKEFRCDNGYCAKNKWLCDGVDDCGDSSDEVNCDNRTILPGKCDNRINRFLCNNGRCIKLNETCNGKNDCGDDSDENETNCNAAKELCKKGFGCSHICNETPNGPSCSCRVGYKLINDRNCKDINECIENPDDLCDQRCINTAGSYRCICAAGYELQDDNKTCKAEGGEALMIFSSKEEIRGYYLKSKTYFPIHQNLHHVLGVSMDANYVYWSDVKHGNEAIFRSYDDGTKPEVIVSAGLGYPEEIAVDWITGNIYFTDTRLKHIAVCNNNGTYCTIVMSENMEMPRGLALNPTAGVMFWSDSGTKPHISIAGMNGKDSKIVTSKNIIWPKGLTIDYPNERLYWIDAKLDTIESSRFDGTDRRKILSTKIIHPYAITLFENKLYWTDWKSKSIESIDKNSEKNRQTIIRETNDIYGIHIYHSLLKPKMSNPCNDNTCSQLCLLAANRSFTCACNMDNVIGTDERTCKPKKKKQHLVIGYENNFIDYYHEIIGRPKQTSKSIIQRITQMAYDSTTGTIIVNDQLENSILRYNPRNNSVNEIIRINEDYVGGLDHDYYGNNLYWSDVRNRAVKIYSLNTNEKIILQFTEEPGDLIVVPEHGTMYVVFKSTKDYHIDRLSMNRADPRDHVVDGLRGPKISLARDVETERIFWSDENYGRIESISIRDSKRKIFHTGLQRPIAIAVLDRHVFWILGGSNTLQWADKFEIISGTKTATIDLSGITDFDVDMVTMNEATYVGVRHECRTNNGNCSHVCLVDATEHRVCACPFGMIIDLDKRSCIVQKVCTDDEIRCSDNNVCIGKIRKCNGIKDCPNGEDEENCVRTITCGIGEFTCNNGQCIDAKNRCNAYFDCADKSDEINCNEDHCKYDEFECSDGRCIGKLLVCDGRNDCHDFTDEIDCHRRICDEMNFRCNSGTCIPKSWKCDGEYDCNDGTDENIVECENHVCTENMFRCGNKRCLGRTLLCDDIDDCGDNSDEKNCNDNKAFGIGGSGCTINEFKCRGIEKCIPLEFRCNEVQDCPNNDDEHHCANCEANEFACKSEKCIPQSWVCDGWNDCGDKSDEKNCESSRGVGNSTTSMTKYAAECEQFRCTIGTCLPYEKVCDGTRDCFDGSDEDGQCSHSCDGINQCEQVCKNTPLGPVCLCREGFTLDQDGNSCRDIDECEHEACSQLCQNQPGSFRCMCHEGYVLRSNGISCKVAGEPMSIITATRKDIRKISASLSSIQVIHRQPNVDVTGLDVNVIQDTIYWSNGLLGIINRLNVRTKDFKVISGLGRPGVLAVDWSTDNVYFHDGDKPASIKACNIEEQKCANIVTIENPAKLMAITVDSRSGWLFWSQTTFELFEDPTGEIYRSDMSGSNQINIAHDKLGVVSGITIDHTRSRLYWVDAFLGVIERSDFNGQNREIFLNHRMYRPVAINIFEDSLYWLIDNSGTLNKCDIHGDKTCVDIDVKSTNVNEMFVISQISRQPIVKNVCQNHECDYMCVPRNDKYSCICPNGYTTAANVSCDNEANGTISPVKFESAMHGLKKIHDGQRARFFTGILITVTVAIAVISAYYYYQVKKLDVQNKCNLSIHFKNPSYGKSDSRLGGEFVLPVPSPGANEYTNPMCEISTNT